MFPLLCRQSPAAPTSGSRSLLAISLPFLGHANAVCSLDCPIQIGFEQPRSSEFPDATLQARLLCGHTAAPDRAEVARSWRSPRNTAGQGRGWANSYHQHNYTYQKGNGLVVKHQGRTVPAGPRGSSRASEQASNPGDLAPCLLSATKAWPFPMFPHSVLVATQHRSRLATDTTFAATAMRHKLKLVFTSSPT